MTSDDLVRALAADLTPVRRLLRVRQRIVVFVVVAMVSIAVGVLGLGARRDIASKLANPSFLVEEALLLLAVTASARAAVRLGVPGDEPGLAARLLPWGGVLAWATLVAVGTAHGAGEPRAHAPEGWCLIKMIAVSVIPAVALWRLVRRGAAHDVVSTGALASLAVGALATATTRAICARDDIVHVFGWHLAPAMIATLACVAVLRPRRRADGSPPGRGAHRTKQPLLREER